MTSAWFDLSSRLQSNTVIVGRRKESPKSFLGKQRAVVTPLIVGGQVSRDINAHNVVTVLTVAQHRR